jgi:hypothetical protein
MASERFLTVQAELQHAPTPMWERWTIDEIDEESARVLITRAGDPADLHEIADQVATGGRARPHELSDFLRAHAMRIELDHGRQQWHDESLAYAPLPLLQTFLRGRSGKPGLPTNRPLREGDVFWVMGTDWPGAAEPLPDLDAEGFAAHIADLRRARADIWDVTAAARQAAKHSSHEVVEKTYAADESRLEAEHG